MVRADRKTVGRIFSLAWPTMLENLMSTAVQYIDTAMVGALGTLATAAVGCTSTVNWLVGSTVSAIGIGFLAYISKAFGAGEGEKSRQASAQAVTVTLFIGLLLTAATTAVSFYVPVWMNADVNIRDAAGRYFLITYSPMLFRTMTIIFGTVLRSAGDTKTPMRVGIAVNLINVVLNFIFIYETRKISVFSREITLFGLGLGTDGAAFASAASYIFGGVFITVKLWKHKTVSPKGQSFKPDGKILSSCFRVAIPNMLQRFATSFGYVVFASMINALGEVPTAAHTIANTVESMFYIPGFGMQTAAATLSGNALGANDDEKLKTTSRAIIFIEVLMMIVTGGLLFAFAPQLMDVFSDDESVIALGSTVLRMVACSEPFYGVTIVIEGMMHGLGKTVRPLVYNVIGMWCIRIAGTYICTKIFSLGLISAWGCMIGHNMFLFVLFMILFITGRWDPMRKKEKDTVKG